MRNGLMAYPVPHVVDLLNLLCDRVHDDTGASVTFFDLDFRKKIKYRRC